LFPIFSTGVVDTGDKFVAGVIDNRGAPSLANISANFQKMRNDFKFILQGLGANDLPTWVQPNAERSGILGLDDMVHIVQAHIVHDTHCCGFGSGIQCFTDPG
jgi:hypothetical protein